MESRRKSTRDHARTFVYRVLTDAAGEPDIKAIILCVSYFVFLVAILIFFLTDNPALDKEGIVLPDAYINLLALVIGTGFASQAAEFYAQTKVARTEVIEEARLEAMTPNNTDVQVIARQRKQDRQMYGEVNKKRPGEFYNELVDREPETYL